MDNKSENTEGVDKAENEAPTTHTVVGKENSASASKDAEVPDGTTGQANKSVGRGWRWLTILLLILMLVGLVLIGGYGFKFYQQYKQAGQENARAVARVEALDERITLERAERVQRDSELKADIAVARRTLEAQAEAIASLSALDREQWMLAELEYLVRLASQRLVTEDRPQGALTLLAAADELLRTMESVDTLAVREVLAKDISALKLVQLVDREGIYSRLGALIPAMLALPAVPSTGLLELSEAAQSDKQSEANASASAQSGEQANMAWHERLWSNAKKTLSGFVRNHFHVRYRDIPVQPLISAEQEQWLRHDLAINLSNAQQALLRGEQGIYDASLAVVAEHLTQYFQGAAQASSLLEEVTLLQRENIVQVLPDISASREALKKLSAKRPRGALTGGRP